MGLRRKWIEFIRGINKLKPPTGPTTRHDGDIGLIIAIIHPHAEQLEQFARIVFVGDVGAVSFAVDGIQINDHRRAFGADLEQIIKRACGTHQGVAPLGVLAILPIGG